MRVLKIGVGKGEVHEVNIDGTLEELQTMVDGHIEPCAPVQIKEHLIEFLANEKGLLKGLSPNENLFPFFFVGNVIAVGVSGEDFESLTDNQIEFIKLWLQRLEMC